MNVTIGSETYRLLDHIWDDHPERVGQVTVDLIVDTILRPERTAPGRSGRIIYWRWVPELSDRGNYLKVIVDPTVTPIVVVTALPDSQERKRQRRN